MRYKLTAGVVIKSENAAKPAAQPSQFLVELINALPAVATSFDYGCGKLRYMNSVLSTTDMLALIDSDIQLSREQIICGTKTSVRALARRSNRLRAYSVPEFTRTSDVYDRAFCINVLSVIPFQVARRQVLALIRSKLKKGGTCVFVVQYRNSDFTRMQCMRNTRFWRDGFVIDSLRGYSFYGLISPDKLAAMVEKAGFDILTQQLNEGSAYLVAQNSATPTPVNFEVHETAFYHITRAPVGVKPKRNTKMA